MRYEQGPAPWDNVLTRVWICRIRFRRRVYTTKHHRNAINFSQPQHWSFLVPEPSRP